MRNKKGFTLIELLAVIVILGLLMAIAIPSVTRYIQQSRVKTLISSIEVYEESAVTLVNDNYFGSLSDSDFIYYIPIECIPIEKGGTDPFGEWGEAYVGVHYNAEEYSYEYYFTFYDKAGYGMKLTKIDEITYSSIENPTSLGYYSIVAQKKDGMKIRMKHCCDTSGAVKLNISTVENQIPATGGLGTFAKSINTKEEAIRNGTYSVEGVSIGTIYYDKETNALLATFINQNPNDSNYEYGIWENDGCSCSETSSKTSGMIKSNKSMAIRWTVGNLTQNTSKNNIRYIRTYKKNKTTGEITYGTMYYIELPYYLNYYK